MKNIILATTLALFLATPAVASDKKPADKKPADKAPAKSDAPASPDDAAKAKQKSFEDIEAFFKEAEEQAKTMPPGCRPDDVQPETSKPVV